MLSIFTHEVYISYRLNYRQYVYSNNERQYKYYSSCSRSTINTTIKEPEASKQDDWGFVLPSMIMVRLLGVTLNVCCCCCALLHVLH